MALPVNPVGTFNPCYMTNLYGASWNDAWNTSIYGSPTQVGANVLANCVGYAQGRMLEIYREQHPSYDPSVLHTHPFTAFNVGAGEWLNVAEAEGFELIDHPVPLSVYVTPNHVGVVEQLDPEGWLCSESGYGSLPAFNLHHSIYETAYGWRSSYAANPIIIGFFKIKGTTPPVPRRTGYDRRRRYRN